MRGAWIEITEAAEPNSPIYGRSPCGERGLKFSADGVLTPQNAGRSPCGERGLKSIQY